MNNKPLHNPRLKLVDEVLPCNRHHFNRTFGYIVEKRLRSVERGVTHFCAATGVDQTIMNSILSATRKCYADPKGKVPYEVTVYMANKVALGLGVPLSELVNEVGKRSPHLIPFVDPETSDASISPRRSLADKRAKNREMALMYSQDIKDVLLDEMRKQKLTHCELALKTGMSNVSLYQLLPIKGKSKKVGDLASYMAIANTLGLTMQELFSRAGN